MASGTDECCPFAGKQMKIQDVDYDNLVTINVVVENLLTRNDNFVAEVSYCTSHMELTHAAMENHTIQEMLFAVVIKFIINVCTDAAEERLTDQDGTPCVAEE